MTDVLSVAVPVVVVAVAIAILRRAMGAKSWQATAWLSVLLAACLGSENFYCTIEEAQAHAYAGKR